MPTALEINDIFWGTTMPITVLLGGEVTDIRARGSYSVRVIDPVIFAGQVGEPESLASGARSIIAMRVMDEVSTASQSAANISQLASQAQALSAQVKTALESDFNALGLTLVSFGIQAIEKAPM